MPNQQPKAVIIAPYLGVHKEVTQEILSGRTSTASDKLQVLVRRLVHEFSVGLHISQASNFKSVSIFHISGTSKTISIVSRFNIVALTFSLET